MSGRVVHAAHRFNRRESMEQRSGEALLSAVKKSMEDLAEHYTPDDISAAFNLSLEYKKLERLVAKLEQCMERVDEIHATHEKGQQS